MFDELINVFVDTNVINYKVPAYSKSAGFIMNFKDLIEISSL